GNYVGIGIEIAFIQDSLIVLYPKKDSPALRAGIQPGDYIIAIDGKNILGDSLNHMDILNRIKGTKGTKVKLTLKPMMADTQRIVEVIRDEIKVPSVPAAYMIDSTVAYIKIDRFMNTTYREFMDAWELLNTKHHAQHLILDLRDNPGGYLKEAVNMLSQFFPEEGKLLVYTEGKNQKRMDYKSTGKVFFPVDHLTVLINGNSASASEIVAGCIQDQDRGVIIGSRSYGKGLVQEQFDLSNGGILRMTVSRYYTPSGRLIQKAYDATSAIDTLKAYSTTMGRPEHAGGGIIPDIEIKDEVKWQNSIMSKWMDIISEYAIHYNLIQHHGEIIPVSQIPTIEKSLPGKETILKDLMELAAKRSSAVVLDSLKSIQQAQPDQLYRIAMASMIAYRTGEEGWYVAYNENDPAVLKAREVVKADPRTLLKK
ncbi:MAG TPA: S41 family peptidase, partial [Saprospiraceae bacterium]|nr:S41 family peptidase [Saprospiraceae bacterium]